MGLKFVVGFGLLLAFSLAVLADTSKHDTTWVDPVKEADVAKDGVEPQQQYGGGGRRGPRGCRYGCCGSYAFGQCSACCATKAEAEAAKVAAEAAKAGEQQPQPQQGRGGCRRGCCGSYAYGQCSYCCP